MVLECQTRGPVEGLHAVSLGDLFDIRRAVWRVCGHGLHGRALGLGQQWICGQGSNGTSGAATYRCGRARLIPLLFTCRSARTTIAARLFRLPASNFDFVATPLLLASATRPFVIPRDGVSRSCDFSDGVHGTNRRDACMVPTTGPGDNYLY